MRPNVAPDSLREHINPGQVRNFFETSNEFAKEAATAKGRAWLAVHNFFTEFGSSEGITLTDAKNIDKAKQGPRQILSDPQDLSPLVFAEELINQNKIGPRLKTLAEQTGRNIYLMFTDEDAPVVPDSLKNKFNDPWEALAEEYKQAGVGTVMVSGMFLRKDLSGCAGEAVKKLRQYGLTVEISDFVNPASPADFETEQ